MQVVIGIATCRRPHGLSRLLQAVERLRVPEDLEVEVLVVDNDLRGSAAEVVRAARAGFPFRLTYVAETRPGVSFARNTILIEAATADALTFIDDDERPEPGWLEAMLRTWQASGAAAVCGPVHPYFERPAPAWLEGAFETVYLRPHPGTPLREIATNNLLLNPGAIHRLGIRFDPALALIGGEDTLFGEALGGRGLRFAWAEHALVHEDVPVERARLAWLLRRWYRTGNIETLIRLRRRSGLAARLRIVAAGILRIALGAAAALALLPLAVLARPLPAVLRIRTVCRGLGMIAAAFGRLHQEYRPAHWPAKAGSRGETPPSDAVEA